MNKSTGCDGYKNQKTIQKINIQAQFSAADNDRILRLLRVVLAAPALRGIPDYPRLHRFPDHQAVLVAQVVSSPVHQAVQVLQ